MKRHLVQIADEPCCVTAIHETRKRIIKVKRYLDGLICRSINHQEVEKLPPIYQDMEELINLLEIGSTDTIYWKNQGILEKWREMG